MGIGSAGLFSKTRVGFVVFALGAMAAVPAVASDGRIEINQAKALAGGVTPGDSPGFPVTISLPGSYLLTGNLDVRGSADPQQVTAIWFLSGSEGAHLDLGGFSLLGPRIDCGNGCPGIIGSGSGVRIPVNFISVSNGTIRGFGGAGVDALNAGSGELAHLVAIENGGSGILTYGHRIHDCEATYNRFHGFLLQNAIVSDSRAVGNLPSGFFATSTILEGSAAVANGNGEGGVGFQMFGGTVRSSVAYDNANGQIACSTGTGVGTTTLGTQASLPSECVPLGPNVCNGAACP